MKRIALLGSTGSIGQNTLGVARHLGKEKIQVVSLAARSNIDLLEQQALEFNPQLVAVFDEKKAIELQKRIPGIKVVGGMAGMLEAAKHDAANFAVSAMSGTLGLLPTVEAIKSGKSIGLANKESLVSGGSLVVRLAKEKGVALIPIDSEHSAIFQCLKGEDKKNVHRLILTASGGPFLHSTQEELNQVTVDQALCHPNWKMGAKVTIDCSTLMNKGLEVIEAHWLFEMPSEKIEVVIHPQSVIHSMVEFDDGSMMAQMSVPTMRIPIQYALTYPERSPGREKPFDFSKHSNLQFFLPNVDKFRCLHLAFHAIHSGGSMPCFMNAANEVLVERFLKREIPWKEIGIKLDQMMETHSVQKIVSFEQLISIDQEARILSARF
jgi:1-deoxy-D-xylulose-5-phosphate reductoisomerase